MSSYYIFDNTSDTVSKKYVDSADAKALSLAGGTMSGNLDMNLNAIVNLKAPIGDSNAATKKYVDDEDAKYLPLSGGRLTGKINMGDNVIEGLDDSSHAQSAATKNFVVSNYVSKSLASTTYLSMTNASADFLRRNSLHPMTANLKMGNHKITSLALPTTNTDAANKAYVDAIDNNLVKLNTANTFIGNNLQSIPKAIIGDLTCSWYSGQNSTLYKQLFIRHPLDHDAGWYIGNQNQAPTTSDNDLYFMVSYSNGSTNIPAYISDSESLTGMNNFTGQHLCQLEGNFSLGKIVVCTGKYLNMDNSTTPSINESLPVVKVCNAIASKKVFGVLSDQEDPNDNSRQVVNGHFVSVYSKANDTVKNRVAVNSVGEGALWVCSANGNLSIGDYIESFLQGYGQRQKSSMLKNSTVAKITQSCNFSDKTKVTIQGVDYFVAFVGCTYHCG